jgi:predicted CoA-substrate-specific enzyme activase
MMITAGIDVGLEQTKVVILKDGTILGKGKVSSGGADRSESVDRAYQAALQEAGLAASDVEKIVATGKGKYNTALAGATLSEQVATARAARFLDAQTTCVISLGADEIMVATLGEAVPIAEYTFNQKCTAGVGLFLESMALRLELSLEELSALDNQAATVNEGCVVFAELDALSLLNHGASPADVGGAVLRAAAVRANSVINDITKPATAHTMLVGGLTKNTAFVRALQEISGLDFVIPAEAEYAGALGAALPKA